MSRSYNMSVHISGHRPDRNPAIRGAADAEWNFEWIEDADHNLYADADGSLAGGETEEEFVDRLSLAIWKANGGFCELQVNATYLEVLPYESHSPTLEDYDRLLTEKREKPL